MLSGPKEPPEVLTPAPDPCPLITYAGTDPSALPLRSSTMSCQVLIPVFVLALPRLCSSMRVASPAGADSETYPFVPLGTATIFSVAITLATVSPVLMKSRIPIPPPSPYVTY